MCHDCKLSRDMIGTWHVADYKFLEKKLKKKVKKKIINYKISRLDTCPGFNSNLTESTKLNPFK